MYTSTSARLHTPLYLAAEQRIDLAEGEAQRNPRKRALPLGRHAQRHAYQGLRFGRRRLPALTPGYRSAAPPLIPVKNKGGCPKRR